MLRCLSSGLGLLVCFAFLPVAAGQAADQPASATADRSGTGFLKPRLAKRKKTRAVSRLAPAISGSPIVVPRLSLPARPQAVSATVGLLQQPVTPPPTRDPGKLRKITTISPFHDYSPLGQARVSRTPQEAGLGDAKFPGRAFQSRVYHWKPSDLYHFPLYFEDPTLERYGHTHHRLLQPFVSATRFGTQLIGLPYQMTIDPIRKKTYTLGWYRPGEPAPMQYYQVPWNTAAAMAQGGVMTGLFFLIP
ncbi:MAG: hypothetical protein QF363_09430 [Planctomycetaceae bacterium]|nr:hypothetical protein [Planctomycetaceae bacterium]